MVIDCGGVGYLCNITLATFSALEGKPDARVWVHEVIRENEWQLFGFATQKEREVFRALIGVSGVGPAIARVILSSESISQLEDCIVRADPRPLKAIKGIGGKTAERIIVDLKDKIKPGDEALSIQPLAPNAAYDEALAALMMLGFTRQQSQKALKKIFDEQPLTSAEQAIKAAFSLM